MRKNVLYLELPDLEKKIELFFYEDTNTWKTHDNLLVINTTPSDDFKILEVIQEGLFSPIEKQIICDLFFEKLVDLKNQQLSNEMLGIETDFGDTKPNKSKPNFDPELIRVDPQIRSIQEVYRMIKEQEIDLSPDFQRHFVWKEKTKKSRLIESLLLRIPLPVFYLASDKNEIYQVVDGLQRLTVIREFYDGNLKLSDLEYLDDCEGKTIETLEPRYRRRINATQLNFNIIHPQTPNAVKFELFKRINLGGKPLNFQEIRNSMATPVTRGLINNLSNSSHFKIATNESINPLRMEDQELVLRFIGFYLNRFHKLFEYKGDIDLFLDDVLEYLNDNPTMFNEISDAFYRGMTNAFHLFSEYAFRKCLTKHLECNAKKQLINKSLFTAWSVLLSKYQIDDIKKYERNCFVKPLVAEIEANVRYFDSISMGTSQKQKLEYSFEVAEKIINEQLGVHI